MHACTTALVYVTPPAWDPCMYLTLLTSKLEILPEGAILELWTMATIVEEGNPPPREKLLRTLTSEETIALLSTYPSLEVYTNHLKSHAVTGFDGESLSALTSSKLVKKSNVLGKIGDAVERSLLAKEVRQLLTTRGEQKIVQLRRSASAEQEEVESFKGKPSGDLNLPYEEWGDIVDAAVSTDGATGVLLMNTSKEFCYVIKAAEFPEREVFATALAIEFGLVTAKQRTLSQKEKKFFRRKLSLHVEATRSKIMDNELKTNEKGEILESDIIQDGEMAIFFHEYKLRKKDFVTAIEYVNDAALLFGMNVDHAKGYLNPETTQGRASLEQIGEIIVFDAFVNNNDRIPVVHSNVGNGRNIMFGRLGTEDNCEVLKPVVAIDQTIASFANADVNDPKSISFNLCSEYKEKVRRWLYSCVNYGKQDHDFVEDSSSSTLGKNGTDIISYLVGKYSQLDSDLAESICRVAGFEKGMTDVIVNNKLMMEYAKTRGAGSGRIGSLLCVRDFIVRNCAYDIGTSGLEIVRKGVCKCIQRIANKSINDIERVYSGVESMQMNNGLNTTSFEMWKYLLRTNVRIEFLKDMLAIFKDAASKIPQE
eukprot:g12912.t1